MRMVQRLLTIVLAYKPALTRDIPSVKEQSIGVLIIVSSGNKTGVSIEEVQFIIIVFFLFMFFFSL